MREGPYGSEEPGGNVSGVLEARGLGLTLRPPPGAPGGREPFPLSGVSFRVERGERIALLGPNGAGKTTLLRLLAGVYRPEVGEVHVAGRTTPVVDLASPFSGELDAREHVESHGVLAGWRPEVDEVLDFAGLGGAAARRPVRLLSTGERARLALAPGLLMEADVYLVDEGLAVCDPTFRRRALERLERRAREGAVVVLAGQDLVTARALCRRGLLLRHGRLVLDDLLDPAIDAFTRPVAGDEDLPPPGMGVRSVPVEPREGGTPPAVPRLEAVEVVAGSGAGDPPVLRCSISGVPPGSRLLVAVKDPEGRVLHASRTSLRPLMDLERAGSDRVELTSGLPVLPGSDPRDPGGLRVALSLTDADGVPLLTRDDAAAYPPRPFRPGDGEEPGGGAGEGTTGGGGAA